MELTKEQKSKFIKLGISSWCELALLIPNSYEDLRLKSKLEDGSAQVIDATVQSISKTPKTIQITFYAHNFSHEVYGVVFSPKPYMIHQFQEGDRAFFYGVIECKMGRCSMNMPKRVSNVGDIKPKYKTPMRTDVMARFVQNNLTLDRLLDEGLLEDIAKVLLSIHMPKEGASYSKDEKLYALKFCEIYNYMKRLKRSKKEFSSFEAGMCEYETWAKQSLPFKLTDEQIKAIEAIRGDFLSNKAARRIVVGDVGSGKTMVILASALMNYPNRSILMAPTTVLANQLFSEAKHYLTNMRVGLVSNKSKIEDLDSYDFLIGTHALLYRDLPHATLVMVDEQHRFGTKQRASLEKFMSHESSHAHYIQFSATPIPRTQAMIESAHIDVSLITTTPYKKDITSKVISKRDFKDLLVHIKDEISQNRQVLIVYPLVEQSDALEYQSLDEARGYWEKNFDSVYVTHGKDREKERVLKEFDKDGSLLLSTTVVEVGISLPRLSTVVIVGAERLGLSTLHQLRGRVSRVGLKGYCFLYTNKDQSKRLDQFCKTSSGFDIALLDLKFRKSGDLLRGQRQSGEAFKWIDLAEDESIIKDVKPYI